MTMKFNELIKSVKDLPFQICVKKNGVSYFGNPYTLAGNDDLASATIIGLSACNAFTPTNMLTIELKSE